MANINGESQASFRWMLSCATIGIAVIVSPCFAQGDRDTSKELPRVKPFACDSLDPKVCLDIYQRRMEQLPERKPDQGWLSREFGQRMVGKSNSWLFDLSSSGTQMNLGTPIPFSGTAPPFK
jgi:hypothetical protein